jgi:hypothetical protein
MDYLHRDGGIGVSVVESEGGSQWTVPIDFVIRSAHAVDRDALRTWMSANASRVCRDARRPLVP